MRRHGDFNVCVRWVPVNPSYGNKMRVPLALAILVGVAVPARAADFDFLKDWIGRYPTVNQRVHGQNTVKDRHPSLWDNTAVQHGLMTLLGGDRFDTLTDEFRVESPITYQSPWATVTVCKEMDCQDGAMVFFNTVTDAVRVCWINKQVWFSPDLPPTEMGEDFCIPDSDEDMPNFVRQMDGIAENYASSPSEDPADD